MNTYADPKNDTWQYRLKSLLPLMGHRNWVVVADSAYPFQSNLGIETIATGVNHKQVLGRTLWAIAELAHVRVTAYLDAELKYVPEKDAPGVKAIRQDIDRLLEGQEVRELEHEQIISKLDENAKIFRILVLKSTLTIPYTSVFLELDCGYWNEEAERRMRTLMRQG
ncbi:MAG: RbsD/FucU domain-containing protein [Terracidiphilus sp.]